MIFRNDTLNTLINAMPTKSEKLQLTMLFALIDGYLAGNISESEFSNDIRVLLNDDLKQKKLVWKKS